MRGRPVIAGRRGGGLAIGLTEADAPLLAGRAAPAPLARDAALLEALHPDFIRIDVDWTALQPSAATAPRLAQAADGCDRGLPPCAPFAGLRDELRAVAAQQRAGAGWEPVVVLYGVPSWAATPAHGCERPGTTSRSRPLNAAGLRGYRRLVASIAALGAREGVALHWWSAWNEPNHPFFVSPQRGACRTRAAALSPGLYATLTRALAQALHALGGDRRLVLGELAGYAASSPHAVGVAEFVAALPQDVVCAGSVWALHDYGAAQGHSPLAGVRALEHALDRRGSCGRGAQIWITETGVGAPDARGRVGTQPTPRDPRAACRAIAAALAAWNSDPRVTAAFQYSFREDPAFRVGLVDAGLTAVLPSYFEWLAWGQRAARSPAPPALPAQCSG